MWNDVWFLGTEFFNFYVIYATVLILTLNMSLVIQLVVNNCGLFNHSCLMYIQVNFSNFAYFVFVVTYSVFSEILLDRFYRFFLFCVCVILRCDLLYQLTPPLEGILTPPGSAGSARRHSCNLSICCHSFGSLPA